MFSRGISETKACEVRRYTDSANALEELRRFSTEHISDRVVHAHGVGAHGVFRLLRDLFIVTEAIFSSAASIKTEVSEGISAAIHGKHTLEPFRGPRGSAINLKTPLDGDWEMVEKKLPMFFIRDRIKLFDMVIGSDLDPVTSLQDPINFLDSSAALGEQATHILTYPFSGLGIPHSCRFIDGNSVRAYKLMTAPKRMRFVNF